MFNLFAHAGHSHSAESMTMLDHCTPVIIGAGIIIALLGGVIVYLLANWQPKKVATKGKAKTQKK